MFYAGTFLCGYFHKNIMTAQSSEIMPYSESSFLTRVTFGIRFIDLVHSNHDRNISGSGMVYRLFRLGHDTIVSSNNKDNNIRNLCTSCPQCGKGFMARRIEENDILSLEVYLVSADMLGNTPCLCLRDFCLPDCIKKRSLPWSTCPMIVITGARCRRVATSS